MHARVSREKETKMAKIKYESNQKFQVDAINAIVDIFEGQPNDIEDFSIAFKNKAQINQQVDMYTEIGAIGNHLVLDEEAILENVKHIQNTNGVPIISELDGMNFSIEMETGTGKTYVYLRTAFELAKRYNFRKFIIIVPSIAIKEGVKASIDSMKAHFESEYPGLRAEAIVYDGKNPEVVQSFATSTMMQFMIMTIDSIRGNRKLVVNEARDKLNGIAPIEYLAAVNPIVIMDEPQNMESELSSSAINDLNPMCTLRYSATHKKKYNLMYVLDPVDAHRQNLVKSIVVANAEQKGVDAKPYIKLLETRNKSGSIEAYLEMVFKDKSGKVSKKSAWVKNHQDLAVKTNNDIYEGYIINDINIIPSMVDISPYGILMENETWGGNNDEIFKAMIRTTVQEHFKRELLLKDSSIKVLSLFFVDRVASYLEYDENGLAVDGKFAQWFDKIYTEERNKNAFYQDILPEDAKEVRTAYFAEMKKGGKTSFVDSKEGKGNSNDESAYDLIMKGKEKLLDINRPERFIFSHSALKEGWDNPNVFQICMMRESSSENDRRQTIGRGLRLAVKKDGNDYIRVYDEHINQLMVVANETYASFADKLQKEYKKAGVNIGLVRKSEFAKIVLIEDENKTLGQTQSERIWNAIHENGYVDNDGKVLANFKPENIGFNLNLPADLKSYTSEVIDIIKNCKIDKFIKNARNKEKIIYNKEVMYSPELENLWKKISGKTTYKVSMNRGEIIMQSIAKIKQYPKIEPIRIETKRNKVLLVRGGIHNGGIVGESSMDLVGTFELPDVVKELQEATSLTRKTIIDIIDGCGRLNDFMINPYDFISMVRSSIQDVLSQIVVDGVQYEKMHDRVYTLREFQEDSKKDVERFIDRIYEVKNKQKTVSDKIELDSVTENEFANYLDNREDIKLFLKLPAKFKIDTPVGLYNPDWAIVKEVDGQEKIYMIRETKNGGERQSELNKIQCAKKHFEAIGLNNYEKSTPANWNI